MVNPGSNNTVVVSRDISHVQPITIQSGTAQFDGIVGSSVTVAPGAVFGGWATLTGDLTNNGRIAQSNSPGIMGVGGNYMQNAGSTMVVRM